MAPPARWKVHLLGGRWWAGWEGGLEARSCRTPRQAGAVGVGRRA